MWGARPNLGSTATRVTSAATPEKASRRSPRASESCKRVRGGCSVTLVSCPGLRSPTRPHVRSRLVQLEPSCEQRPRRAPDLKGPSGVGAISKTAFLADRPIKHAFVLGGSGFLGAPLVRRLCAAGVRTTCLLHRTPLPVAEARVVGGSLDRFPWWTLEQDPPDVIFHLARIAGRGGIRGAVTRVRNRVANERLLLALTAWARPPLVVFVGGTLAYGSHHEEPVTEQTPLAPTSFSRDYHHAELPWLRAQRENDAPVIVARPAWVLGPGAWFEAFYRRFLRAERAVPLYGPGDNWMSLVQD